MATYAALTSLSNTLVHMLNPLNHSHQFIPFKKQQTDFLYEYVSFLQDLLEMASSGGGEGVVSSEDDDHLEENIRDAAQEAESLIESHIRNHLLLGSENEDGYESFKVCCQGLERILQRLDSLKNELVIKVKDGNRSRQEMEQLRDPTMPVRSSRPFRSSKNTLVGFENEFLYMEKKITRQGSNLHIIPIVGMGGLGKTTFAKSLYNAPVIREHFVTRAWATVSQEPYVRNILLCLLNHTMILTPQIHQASDENLREYLRQSLRGRRYLIVLDDVWDFQFWDYVKCCFPDNANGSCILLTTRILTVADYVNPSELHYHKRTLSEDESWKLLCEKVFGTYDNCNWKFEHILRFLAKQLRGLPLAIVVLGGLLSKVKMSQEFLEHVVDKFSKAGSYDEKCYLILHLSYIYLPHYLKPCFLYMGAFPEDHEIRISRLFKLWAAEGFLRPTGFRTMEQTAEEYLMELIDWNLIFVHEWGSNGKIKTCGVHDILREMCLKIAQEENFLHFSARRHLRSTLTGIQSKRRLAVYSDDMEHEHGDSDDHDSDSDDPLNLTGILMRHQLNISSFLFVGHPIDNKETSANGLQFKLLRVFDIVNLIFIGFPEEILQLVNLRYLAFTCHSNIPSSISLLWNLQTFINYGSSDIPSGIWEMPWLEHVQFNKGLLPDPVCGRKSLFLKSLETFSEVTNLRFTDEILERLRNVRKLKIYYGNPSSSNLHNLPRLQKVETLKITCCSMLKAGILQSLAFPWNLKRLTLSGCRIPWEYISVVGSLPKLEVLKLEDHAFKGLIWKTVKGEFHELKFLLLSELDLMEWGVKDSHFPNLERLVIDHCLQLKEIPSTIGYISKLELIKVINSSPGAMNSARIIQQEQDDLGNSNLQFDIINNLGHQL